MSGVLVTGASGFIGLPVLERLAGAGRELHALSTRARPPQVAGVQWHQLDLADSAALEQLIDELAPQQLVHLAWCTEHGRFWHTAENVTWVERSLRLLRAFVRRGGERAVMLGTCAEYDWSTIDGPLVEASSPLAPATLYGIAKDALRRVALAYSETQGVELAWGRVFLLYGPHEKPARLVPSVIHSLLNEQPIATGGGSQVRDLMHVEDVAGAIVALLDSSVVGAVNIASGIEVAVAEVVEEIVKLAGHPDLVCQGARPDRPGEPAVLVADVSRLHDEVGFRPRWGLGDGLAATVRWWEAQERGLIPPAALCKDAPPCSPLPAWPVRRR